MAVTKELRDLRLEFLSARGNVLRDGGAESLLTNDNRRLRPPAGIILQTGGPPGPGRFGREIGDYRACLTPMPPAICIITALLTVEMSFMGTKPRTAMLPS